MNKRRSGVGLAVVDEKIYAVCYLIKNKSESGPAGWRFRRIDLLEVCGGF